MPARRIAALGWENCVQLSNGSAELLITVDVGPRILSYKLSGGESVLRAFPDELGKSGETGFVGRGGHRLWISPETERTYAPDNGPVKFELKHPNAVQLANPANDRWRVRKEMRVSLAAESSAAIIQHRIINEGEKPISVAAWGLTIMTPGGTVIIPQPPLGTHGKEFLPNRVLVPWTYTDFSDDRWKLDRHFFFLQPKQGRAATKLGMSHRDRWVAYLLPRMLFLKVFDYEEGAVYPDFGCNFETFSKDDFIELETLSQLKELAPGDSVGHTEAWHLFAIDAPPDIGDEKALQEWFLPYTSNLGVP